MPAARKEPRAGVHVRLSLGGKGSVGVFRDVSGMDSESEVVEERSADERGAPVTRKVAGSAKWSNIVLKRGIDESLDLWKWRDTVIKQGPNAARVDGKIELVDQLGQPIASFQFKQGWPIKYSAGTLAGPGQTAPVEEVHIAHEGLERV